MKAVVESYIGIWIIMFFLMLCMAFTSINLNIGQARNVYNSIRAECKASNGAIISDSDGDGLSDYIPLAQVLDANTLKYDSESANITISSNGYKYKYTITRLSLDDGINRADDETFKYNDIYQIDLVYEYSVPLFGRQVYPISGLIAY